VTPVTVTVKNIGVGSLSLTIIKKINGDDYTLNNLPSSWPVVLLDQAPGNEITFNVALNAANLGTDTGLFEIDNSDAKKPFIRWRLRLW